MDSVVRPATAILTLALLTVCPFAGALCADESMIESGITPLALAPAAQAAPALRLAAYDPCDEWWNPRGCAAGTAAGEELDEDMSWLNGLRVGYDNGFVIASRRERNLGTSEYPFRLKFNGWGQLRHSRSEWEPPDSDLNQFQLKRGRLAFSGTAFNPNFFFFIQLDGRSSSGDDIRLLDYFLSFDFGREQFGLKKGTIGFRTGKYKVPFTMSRWLSGQQFEFSDRSVASMFFDVNRSFAWGLYGESDVGGMLRRPIIWDAAIFNGLVTGGAETGSSGNLDENFAYSFRLSSTPVGDWGVGSLADLDWHECPALRVGCGFASSRISRNGETEFTTLRVVDSGETLASLLDNTLPTDVQSYVVTLYSIDTSFKYRGWSGTMEYYWRGIHNFTGADVSDLFDHGFWLQFGYFVVPRKVQLITRWSRVVGNSGTLGNGNQSADEIAGGFAWYFKDNNAKVVFDITNINGSPVNASSLDLDPGNRGVLYRTQIQFSF